MRWSHSISQHDNGVNQINNWVESDLNLQATKTLALIPCKDGGKGKGVLYIIADIPLDIYEQEYNQIWQFNNPAFKPALSTHNTQYISSLQWLIVP